MVYNLTIKRVLTLKNKSNYKIDRISIVNRHCMDRRINKARDSMFYTKLWNLKANK